jgi:hypothetical protein
VSSLLAVVLQIPKSSTGRKLAHGRHLTSLASDFPESLLRMRRVLHCIWILNYYKLGFYEQWQFSQDFSAASRAYARELEQALLANLANSTLGNTTSAIRSAGDYMPLRLVFIAGNATLKM